LYNFIIDTFKDPESETAKRSAEELLKWWNGYVYVQYLVSEALTDYILTKSFLHPVLMMEAPWMHERQCRNLGGGLGRLIQGMRLVTVRAARTPSGKELK